MKPLVCFSILQSASSSPEATAYTALAIVGGLAIAVGIAVWAIRNGLSRKRTEALADAATEVGFTFVGEMRPPDLQTPLFGKGRDHQFKNVMIGDRARCKVSVFDYSFTVGRGKSQQTHAQTVASFSKEGVSLPYFELRPANIADKVWDAVAHKNIHFDAEPEFARRYVLQGALPDKVRELFTPRLISFLDGLDAHEKWHIEGVGSTLVIYHSDKKTPPEQMREFLDQTTQIATTFLSFARVEAAARTPS